MPNNIIKHDVKVMLASNLKSSDKVLDVLQRSGRSFGSVEFFHMSPDDAAVLRQSMGLPERYFDRPVTLAEAICDEVVRIGSDKVRMGFAT